MGNLIYLLVGLIAGGVITWLLVRSRAALLNAVGKSAAEAQQAGLQERLNSAERDLAGINARLKESQETCERLSELRQTNGRLEGELKQNREALEQVRREHEAVTADRETLAEKQLNDRVTIAELTTTLEQERMQGQEKLALLTAAREELSAQFKVVANQILDEKSRKFTEQNATILNPLKEKITEFQQRVQQIHEQEIKDRSAFGEQVKNLTLLNTTLSQDAQNLTLALKGNRKAQGNWGEIILEDLLERAELKAGQHYDVQKSVKSEDGLSRDIPDVVVHLPGGRDIVIDSKLTLPDYRAFAAADDETERAAALKRHIACTRQHMKGLCEKQYQALHGLRSLDFVIMFFPLEPAFMLAVTHDRELFNEAWNKNVLLVSPSTLLFVIRTVANLWRTEDQSRNAQEIARRGAELYDKLVGFTEDLEKVGKALSSAQENFTLARRKMSEGRGNVIGQAESLRSLGVKPTKALGFSWTDRSVEDAEVLRINDSATIEVPSASRAAGA